MGPPPWWLWLLGIAAAIVIGVVRAAARTRRILVAELVGALARLRPDLTVLRFDASLLGAWVAVRTASGEEVTSSLQGLLTELGQPRTPDERAALVERWAKSIHD